MICHGMSHMAFLQCRKINNMWYVENEIRDIFGLKTDVELLNLNVKLFMVFRHLLVNLTRYCWS